MSHFHRLPIDEIRDETPDAYTLYLLNPDPVAFAYKAGQYLTVKTEVAGESLRRAYSLSSSPLSDKRLAMTIKRTGKVSEHLRQALQAGDYLEVMPPMGNFSFSPDPTRSRHYILVGAGSGITPLYSILKTALEGEPLSKVTLWYGNRDQSSVIFREELEALVQKHPDRLQVVHCLSNPEAGWKGFTGRLDKDRVYGLLLDLFMVDEYRKTYYLCGPQGMMDAAEAAMDKHAVNPDDIHREYYSAPVPTEEDFHRSRHSHVVPEPEEEEEIEIIDRKIKVTLDGKTRELLVKTNKSILDAALQSRLDAPYACQSGVCTTCRARLLRGSITMDEDSGLSESEIEEGYILTCQSHPLSDDVEIEYE